MSFQIKAIVFLAGTLAIAWISRSSLGKVRSHGFYRFFAWETILGLILLNLDGWFYQPFRFNQLVSWVLLTASLFLVIVGVQWLRRQGKPDPRRSDPGLVGIEKTTELVTTGIYAYIRHPLYSSLLFLTWGVFFKRLSLLGFCLAGLSSISLWITARMEETENIKYFGLAYESYKERTKMFIPFII